MTRTTKPKLLKPIYLIYGTEKLLLEEAVERLRQRLSLESNLDFDCDEFDGEMSDGTAIVQAAETLPFVSEKRLVVVKNVEKLPPSDQSTIAEYAKHPSEKTCLVLIATKINKGSKIFKTIKEQGGVFEYKAPYRNKYPKWIQEEFSKRGKIITQEIAEYLLEKVGYNLQLLLNEIEKISLFCAEEKKIDLSAVMFLTEKTVKYNVFDFVDSVGRRDQSRALSVLGNLLQESESAGHIFYMLVRHLRLLLKTKALLGKGVDRSKLAQALQITPFEANKYQEQSKNFTETQLKNIFKLLLETDLALKRSEQEPRFVLESLILKIL